MSETKFIDTSLELRAEINKTKYVERHLKVEVWDSNGNEYRIAKIVDDQDGDRPILRIEIETVDALFIPPSDEDNTEPSDDSPTEEPTENQ